MFLRFSLDAYYRWLCKVIEYTRKTFRQDERFFFINAWNEWAEGAYLEPDKKYGYAYLNTTSRALFGLPLTEGVVLNDASGSLGEMSAAKYDQNYDWVKTQIVAGGDYSLAKMDHYITSGSEILEFGSASGYFTRYLKEEKKAIVDIAEIDPDCAAQAARHARDCVVGDIEQHLWAQEYAGRKYDYILFADVLEHLRDPWFMLESVKPFLADDGQILISLPNIAHKEIIAALYNNDFSYANVGIMDKTHLRFFTERTVRELISQSGLHLREMQYVNAPVLPEGCGTRLNKTQVPRELQAFLSKKQHANVIQFVASCRKTPS
jgi:2-polyprenyl-3-methyl-5-hydroxy-6-metoxy-1,4-benzoquinol methylase